MYREALNRRIYQAAKFEVRLYLCLLTRNKTHLPILSRSLSTLGSRIIKEEVDFSLVFREFAAFIVAIPSATLPHESLGIV